MTLVTDVAYGHYDYDDTEMRLTLYRVPVDDYTPGMREEEAARLSTRPATHPDAPGARGVENYRRGADGQPVRDPTSCGVHTWDDGLITDRTPAPAGRCPWEHLHEEEDE